jgi:hypothetical protein
LFFFFFTIETVVHRRPIPVVVTIDAVVSTIEIVMFRFSFFFFSYVGTILKELLLNQGSDIGRRTI